MNAIKDHALRSLITAAAVVAVAGCENNLGPDDLLVMSLGSLEENSSLYTFEQSSGSERLAGVGMSEARAALRACGTELSQWERFPSLSHPDLGLYHYWRCTSDDVTIIAEVYWGGAMGLKGHLGTDGVRYSACEPRQCPTRLYAPFEG